MECRANLINLSSLIFPSTRLQSSLVKELDKIKYLSFREFVWCTLVYGNKYLLTKRAIIEPTIIKVNLVVDKNSSEQLLKLTLKANNLLHRSKRTTLQIRIKFQEY